MVKLYNEVLGAEVDLPDAPARIVSFSPAATETVFRIGLGDAVVGVSAFCARPHEASLKRRVGSYNTVSKEVLDGIRPDLILTVTGYQRDFALAMSKRYPVYPLELPVSVAGIVDFVVKVGLVVGLPDEARELASSMIRQLSRIPPAKGVRTYVEIDLGGPTSFGAHSYITDAIRLLGCSSIFETERCEWLRPDLNLVLEGDPDAVVYEAKMYSKFVEGDLRKLIESRGWKEMRAVANGNLFLTPGPLDFLAHHGPSFITEVMPWLSQRLIGAGERLGR